MKRIKRSAVALVLAGAGMTGLGGVATAYWTTHGSGSGSAATSTLQPVGVAAGPVTSLSPGQSAGLVLKLANPNSVPVTIVSIAATGSIAVTGASGACTTTGVTFSPPTDLSGFASLAAGATDVTITLSGAMAMSTTSDSGCQGATFTVPVTVSVRS